MKKTRRALVEDTLRHSIEAGVADGVFPGASAAVAQKEGAAWELVEMAAGHLAPGESGVRTTTVYDLASLTKPFVAMSALALVERGEMRLSSRVGDLWPAMESEPIAQSTVRQLFDHSSGLAPWAKLYLDVPHAAGTEAARSWMLKEAASRLEEPPGRTVRYSDLGYILGGELLAYVSRRSLSEVVLKEVLQPLQIESAVGFARDYTEPYRTEWRRSVAPTEYCEWRGRLVRGEVHDENCYALGGVSGHAGLFGPAGAVAAFGCAMVDALNGLSKRWSRAVLADALTDRSGTTYRLGWDRRSGPGSAAGRMGPRTFGHLGFTGTSLWCDPDARLVVVLLSNRVHPTRDNLKIRGFRPGFHDRAVSCLEAGSTST